MAAFQDWVDRAKHVGIDKVIAERGITLRGGAGKLAGPCPHCGGTDRFAVDVSRGLFNCRQCGGKGQGAISFVMFLDGLSFLQAVEAMNGEPPPKPERSSNQRGDGKPLGVLVCAYAYTDELGELLYQVLRFDPKRFLQRRPDRERPELWVNNLDDVRLVPYRLPALIEAMSNGQTVFWFEGEKDADNAAKLGLAATTTAMGVVGRKHWAAGIYDSFFEGADVVLVPDQDTGNQQIKGTDLARVIGRRLKAVASRVRVVTLPRKDFSDWLEAGGTREAFDVLCEVAPDFIDGNGADHADAEPPPWQAEPEPELPALVYINIGAWIGKPAPDRRWAVTNRIPMANVTLLSGDGGLGKTLLAQQLAVATVLGRDWLGTLPLPGPVMLISAEDDEAEIHFRLERIVQAYGVDFDAVARDLHVVSLVGKEAALAIRTPSGLIRPTPLFESICRDAERIKPVWIGFDTAADIFIVEERDRSQARQCINLLRGLAVRVDCAALLLSHPSQAGIREGHGQSGSTAWNNSVRSRLYLYRPEDEESGNIDADVRVLEVMKANYSAHGDKLRLRWRDGLLVPEPGQVFGPTAYDRATTESAAVALFKKLLEFHNINDIPVSPNSGARNLAPSVFAKLPETKALHSSYRGRMHLLRDAMHALLKAGEVQTGTGPMRQKPSKRNQCLYLARLHPDTDPQQKLRL